jgi:hypothetical protein
MRAGRLPMPFETVSAIASFKNAKQGSLTISIHYYTILIALYPIYNIMCEISGRRGRAKHPIEAVRCWSIVGARDLRASAGRLCGIRAGARAAAAGCALDLQQNGTEYDCDLGRLP